jgi:hypothetical protein
VVVFVLLDGKTFDTFKHFGESGRPLDAFGTTEIRMEKGLETRVFAFINVGELPDQWGEASSDGFEIRQFHGNFLCECFPEFQSITFVEKCSWSHRMFRELPRHLAM